MKTKPNWEANLLFLLNRNAITFTKAGLKIDQNYNGFPLQRGQVFKCIRLNEGSFNILTDLSQVKNYNVRK